MGLRPTCMDESHLESRSFDAVNRATSIFDRSRSSGKRVGCFVAPPITLPPRAAASSVTEVPQDHATDTGTGSIAKIKSCSIRLLFSNQSPQPELALVCPCECATI